MIASIVVGLIVGGLFLVVIIRMMGNSGRPGINESNSFPYDSGTAIPPPSWSSDQQIDAANCDSGNGGDAGDGGGCGDGGGGGGD